MFAGIAPAAPASRYLAQVGYDTVRGLTHHHPVYTGHPGGAPATPPARAGICDSRSRRGRSRGSADPLTSSGMTLMPGGCTPGCKPG